ALCVGKDALACDERFEYLQLWRENDQIGVSPDLQSTLRFESDDPRRSQRCHRYGFVERDVDSFKHCADKIDHAGNAARKRQLIRLKPHASRNDAVAPVKRKMRAIRKAGARNCIGHKTNTVPTFRAIEELHQGAGDVVSVGYQFASYTFLAHCVLQQSGNAIWSSLSCRRHAVKCVGHAAHTCRKPGARFFVPGIAMASTHADPARVKLFYCL